MPDLEQEMKLWYSGNTHACVGYSDGSGSGCGQILPPPVHMLRDLRSGNTINGLQACVRTDNFGTVCAPVKKLYTPNVLIDNWAWILAAVVVAYLLYDHFNQKPRVNP